MLQPQLSIDFQHFQLSSISQLLLANTPQRNRANLRLKGKRTLKATSSRTNLAVFFRLCFFYFCISQVNLLISVIGKKLHYPPLSMNFVLVKQEHTCNPSAP